jgi:adenylate cyclase
VIDDDPTARELLARYLQDNGFAVVTAAGGREGLQRAREERPIAITLDVLMPEVDGWEVLAALRADPELAGIPVIMATIVDEPRQGMALGASGYLTKPIQRDRLTALLRQIPAGGTARVLVVEDDPTQRALLRNWLEAERCLIREAENGLKALDRLREERPDLILLDLMMPQMDGFELLAAMQQQPAWRDIPVIVITALDLSAGERARLNAGVSSLLQKGQFEPEALVAQVRRLARRTPLAETRL